MHVARADRSARRAAISDRIDARICNSTAIVALPMQLQVSHDLRGCCEASLRVETRCLVDTADLVTVLRAPGAQNFLTWSATPIRTRRTRTHTHVPARAPRGARGTAGVSGVLRVYSRSP